MSTEARELNAMLDIAEAAIRDAQAFEHESGLASRHTRKLPADLLRTLHRWRSEHNLSTAAATLYDKSGARAPGDSGQPTAGDEDHIVCEELPPVPAGPATSVRIPEELRERVEQ